jgi:hypothetical protein
MKKKTAPKKNLPTKQDFVGALMANFLYAVAQEPTVPAYFRAGAKKLQVKWDSLGTFQLQNPIVVAKLEKALFG